MITAGIDCGAKNTKTIIIKDGKIIGKGKQLTGFDQKQAVEKSLEEAIQAAGIVRDDIQRICGTPDPGKIPFPWQTMRSMISEPCRKGPIFRNIFRRTARCPAAVRTIWMICFN